MKNLNSTSAKNVSTKEVKNVENKKLLSQINAIGITEKIKSTSVKSIFKKEYNNKADRTKCRNAFQNAISLFLLFVAKGNKELAEAEYQKALTIANKYYLAESTFVNVGDYATNNMDENKKNAIQLFIENAPKAEIKEKKVRSPRKKKESITDVKNVDEKENILV